MVKPIGTNRAGGRNRLAGEKSPYLLQHATNPVDWYPWGPEAFQRAREQDKPIFLSIGYSTCHWCHVMAHESFEDREVADLMNEAFVSIKVDREERPDIDAVYMTACQMMTRSGGWPLTIIMTPDKRPFFAATYIPRATRSGRIGMLDLIPRVRELWVNRRDEVFGSADQVARALLEASRREPGGRLGESLLKRAYGELLGRFDARAGGFGPPPKFPSAHTLLFLLRYWKRTGEEGALEMVEKTLRHMRLGGIYDHVGFGFHRYSTDSIWLVPHFEKMLYDQAMLAMAYTEAYQVTGKELYGETAREIFAYVLRELTSPDGGFLSAEDADSEGREGAFYLWSEEEIRKVLDEKEADFVCRAFDIQADGNFLEESTGRKGGKNILHMKAPLEELASASDLTEREAEGIWRSAREKLFEARIRRARPHRDDKILTDWNGLMIAAMAKGARAFVEPAYGEAARRAADFVLAKLTTRDGGLLHRYRDGQAAVAAHLDDYAFMVWAMLELYHVGFDARDLRTAIDLTRRMIDLFWDGEEGGFFSTAADQEPLLFRPKDAYDGAIPSGNSVSMLNLLRLHRMTGEPEYAGMAEKLGQAFSRDAGGLPSAFTALMSALAFECGPSCEIVVVGGTKAQDTRRVLSRLAAHFSPGTVVLLRPADEAKPDIDRISAFTRDRMPVGERPTIYVCRDFACQRPTHDIEEALALVEGR